MNLLSFDFWFNYRFLALLPIFEKLFYGSVVLFLALTIFFFFWKKKKSLYTGLWLNCFNFSLTNFIVGVILLFFYYEQVAFFSARVWLGIWAIEIVIWLINIVRHLLRIPQKKRQLKAQMDYNRYIPR
jgi:hypothetical protein